MRRKLWLLCALAAFGWTLVSADPASAARRDGMSNSELIKDKDDVFTYPQLAVDYTNMVSFEYGGSLAQGNALGLFGTDTYGVGVALHRGTMFEMRGLNAGAANRGLVSGINPENPGGPNPFNFDLIPTRSYPYPSPDGQAVATPQGPVNGRYGGYQPAHTVFDLLGGFGLGNGAVGARLSLGVGGGMFDGSGDDEDLTNEGQLYFLFRGGYSGSFGNLSVDTSLSFVTNSGDNNNLGSGDDVTAASVTGVALDGRIYNDFTDQVALGGLFDLGFASTTQTNEAPDDEPVTTASNFLIQAGAGPVFTIGGEDEGEGGESVAKFAQFGAEDDEDNPDAGSGTDTGTGTGTGTSSGTATDATKPSPGESTTGTESESGTESTTMGASEEEEETTTRTTGTTTQTAGAQTTQPGAAARRKPAKTKDPFKQSAEIAGYTVFGFSSISGEPNDEQDDDRYGASSLIMPGFHLAGEFHILKWLYFRSGAQYYFHHFSGRYEDGDGTNRVGGDNSAFGWSAGMGVEVGDFRFDGAFNNSFLRGGPNFISGYSGGLFATASAQYRW